LCACGLYVYNANTRTTVCEHSYVYI